MLPVRTKTRVDMSRSVFVIERDTFALQIACKALSCNYSRIQSTYNSKSQQRSSRLWWRCRSRASLKCSIGVLTVILFLRQGDCTPNSRSRVVLAQCSTCQIRGGGHEDGRSPLARGLCSMTRVVHCAPSYVRCFQQTSVSPLQLMSGLRCRTKDCRRVEVGASARTCAKEILRYPLLD